MRSFLLGILFITALTCKVNGQNRDTDSLRLLLNTQPADSNRVNLVLKVAQTYYFSKPDSSLFLAEEALELSRSLRFTKGEVTALNIAGEALRFLGDYPRALKMQMEALGLNRKMKDRDGEASSLGFIGFTYVEFGEFRLALQYMLPAVKLSREVANQLMETFNLSNIGNAYDMLKIPDSALYYQRMAINRYEGLKHGPLKSLILTRYGNAFASLKRKDSALIYYHKGLQNAYAINDRVNHAKIQGKMAELYESAGQYDSSLYYARQAIRSGQVSAQALVQLEASNLLVKLFRMAKNADSAFFYDEIAKKMTDHLYGPQKFRELQLLMLEEQQQQQKNIQEQEQFRNKIKYIALLSALGVFLLLAFILFRNNRHKQKANALLQEQKNKIEDAMAGLKSTQSQLVQREKMASLGELTAGIAHEIQNPLNFVNNFSEVNAELIDEAGQEIDKGNIAGAITILKDIKENEQKINQHGKRADAIVKGMLQHSRSSSGVKEPTDINALAEEYLRLAYHGLRAKDKSFNATMETSYDESIGNINIIPQDIGRVILNLLTNAFYAVTEKRKQAGADYQPTVSVRTKKRNGKVEISVADNGNGIPQKVLDKIFQPFFTTRPTGQGTGLGLSLSYDIVQAHGGELRVETKEKEGSTFIIQLQAT